MSRLTASALEIIKNATYHILEEATVRIMRSGYSTIVKESRDISVSIHDLEGQLVAQPIVQPVHLGNLEQQIKGVIRRFGDAVAPGDCFIVNHPYEDCQNHASDVTLIAPMFCQGRLIAWVGNTAHKPDFGGKVPGSNAGDATDTIQEGLLLPPIKVVSRYNQINREVWEIIRANTRTPELTLGDIRAQIGANFVVEREVGELIGKYGLESVLDCWAEWIAVGEQILRERIRTLFPEGQWTATDYMDDDGIERDRPYRMSVTVERRGEDLHFTFDSDPQATGPINFRPCMTASAAFFCVKAALAPDLPNNAGFQRPIHLHFPPRGSLINPGYLAPVNMYSMASLRMADILLAALAQALPDRVPAPASGYICGVALSGHNRETDRRYVQYEIYVGGTGGRPMADGIAGMDPNVTNSMNTPVEAVETEFPIRVERYELIPGSAGAGHFRGGLGIRRDYRMLAERTIFNLRSDRNRFAPQGLFGGGAAQTARCVLNPDSPGAREIHSKAAGVVLRQGDLLSLRTPGGGGWGPPVKRDAQAVRDDVVDGYVSVEEAAEKYGVVIDRATMAVDARATAALRAKLVGAAS